MTLAENILSPPRNIEAEQALLGAILVNNNAFHRVSEILQPEHFAEGVNGRIFAAIGRLIDRGSIANPVTLKNLFDQDAALQQIGGAKYLINLASSVVTVFNAPDYASQIRDCWLRRQLIELSLETIESAQITALEGDGANDIREALETRLLALHEAGRSSREPRHLGDFAELAVTEADKAFKRNGKIVGVPTGLHDLDRLTGGLQRGDLIYLAGRPSMGKSALAGTIALNAAMAGHPVFLVSPEMSGEQVATRAISARTRLASHRIRTGQLEAHDFEAMLGATNELRKLPVLVDDVSGPTMATLRSRLRRFLMRAPKMPGAGTIDGEPATPLVIVDYLQLMNVAGKRRDATRNEDMSEASRGLKAMAKEFGVPLLVLSQLSRQVESRDNKRPMLSDLRDSGSLEQDADIVMFVFREEYYLRNEEPTRRAGESTEKFEARSSDWQDSMSRARNMAELIIAKQRNGPTGKIPLRFDGDTASFSSLAHSQPTDSRAPVYGALGEG